MLSFLVQHGIKNNKVKDDIIRISFFVFNGIIGSILVSDLIRLFYGTIPEKPYIEYGIATGLAVSPYVYDGFTLMNEKTNNVALALGMVIGSLLCDQSEENGKKKKKEDEEKKKASGIGKYPDYRKQAAKIALHPHHQKYHHKHNDPEVEEDEVDLLSKAGDYKNKEKEKSAAEKAHERRMSRYMVIG